MGMRDRLRMPLRVVGGHDGFRLIAVFATQVANGSIRPIAGLQFVA